MDTIKITKSDIQNENFQYCIISNYNVHLNFHDAQNKVNNTTLFFQGMIEQNLEINIYII